MHPLTYFVDESIKTKNGDDIAAIIAIKTIVSSKLEVLIQEAIDKVISDPVLSQHNGITSNWTPHFCSDHPFDVHPFFLREISKMPFEAYIVYSSKSKLSQSAEYDWYNDLIKILFSFRFSVDKDRIEKIIFEQHDSKFLKRQSELQTILQDLSNMTARRLRQDSPEILVQSGGKNVLPLCLPDYLGGCFMSYLCEDDHVQRNIKRRNFDLIKKKIRWIKDLDRKIIFTSKTPFKID